MLLLQFGVLLTCHFGFRARLDDDRGRGVYRVLSLTRNTWAPFPANCPLINPFTTTLPTVYHKNSSYLWLSVLTSTRIGRKLAAKKPHDLTDDIWFPTKGEKISLFDLDPVAFNLVLCSVC